MLPALSARSVKAAAVVGAAYGIDHRWRSERVDGYGRRAAGLHLRSADAAAKIAAVRAGPLVLSGDCRKSSRKALFSTRRGRPAASMAAGVDAHRCLRTCGLPSKGWHVPVPPLTSSASSHSASIPAKKL